jgi:hypothetical protein
MDHGLAFIREVPSHPADELQVVQSLRLMHSAITEADLCIRAVPKLCPKFVRNIVKERNISKNIEKEKDRKR